MTGVPDPAPLVPLGVRLAGARVLCVGAGPVAAAKALPLLDAGARLEVVAPEAGEAVAAAAEAGRLTWHRRPWREADCEDALLVLAATADPERNVAVAAACAARATLCVRVDAGGDGSADLTAVVRRGPLVLSVSTSGLAPTLARRVRTQLEAAYGPEWGDLVRLYGDLRRDPAVRAALTGLDDAERRRRWRAIPVPDILRLIRTGAYRDAKRAASACLSSSSG